MSSSSDRNGESKPSKPAENPFIKFRQFADEHVGSLLQGIIGLPSAFSNKPSGNARWADFDEDLRRRDELQARQRELRESEARKTQGDEGDQRQQDESQRKEDQEAPQQTSGWDKPVMKNYLPNSVSEGRDIPLYSLVTKELFTHLLPADSSKDWNQYHRVLSSKDLDIFRLDYFPFKLRKDQMPSSDMETLQFLAYNELESSSTFRSEYSLLPYLLFSPYSPIRLHIEGHQQHRNAGAVLDGFPYQAAFEDLIRTQQGNIGSPWPRSIRAFSPFSTMSILGGTHSGMAWMAWLHDLYGEDMLQEREIRDLPRLADMIPSSAFKPRANDSAAKIDEDDDEAARTEQDMYDRFLQWASTPSTVAGALNALDSLCADAEGLIEKQLKALGTPDGKQAVQELLESGFGDSTVGKDLRKAFGLLHTESKPAQEKALEEPLAKAGQNPEQIVSTSTTTSHTTNEDGSVETCVTVWKRFADGRESVTTTNHFEDPASAEGDESSYANKSNSRTIEEQRAEKPKEGARKGWFWN